MRMVQDGDPKWLWVKIKGLGTTGGWASFPLQGIFIEFLGAAGIFDPPNQFPVLYRWFRLWVERLEASKDKR